MTLQLKDKNGSVLSTGTIDLPLETMVVGASYNADTQEIELTLKNGSKVSFSVSDLVKGLVNEDDLSDTLQDYALKTSIPTKLSQLAEDSTHRLVTDTEKATWNNKVDKVSGKGLSTNDFTNELKSKLDGIEDNAQVNKIEKISLDGVEQEIVEKEVNIKSYDINKYFYNALTYNELKGNDLTFEDSIEFPLGKLDMEGKSEQDLSKMTYKCNGTETGDYYFTYEDTNYQFTMPSVTSSSILVFDTLTLKLSINDEEITTSNNNTGTLIELSATPNPDYPQEINSIEGDLEYINYANKNFLNVNNDSFNWNASKVESFNGCYVKLNKSNNYGISVQRFTDYQNVFLPKDKELTLITQYISGVNNFDGSYQPVIYIYFKYDDNTEKNMSFYPTDSNTLNSGYYKKTFTPPKNIIGIALGTYVMSNGHTMTDLVYGLSVGYGIEEFEPSKVRTLTIPTNGQVFRKVGDVADKLIVDMKTGDYYKEGNIGEIVLNGSESWNIDLEQSSSKYRSFFKALGFIKNSPVIANYLISSNAADLYYNDVQGIGTNWGGATRIKIFDESLNSVSALKTYLQQKNLIVDGKLETPTLEKLGTLTKEQLDTLVTFKGYNNVMINTNLGQADIDIEYVLDMKKYIDNKIAEISAQMI